MHSMAFLHIMDDSGITNWRGEQRRITEWNGQSELTESPNNLGGTFLSNMKAPVHRWFRYSAGFSFGLVEESLRLFRVKSNDIVLDPFVGSGTTSVSAKLSGINSIGAELHPLISWIARTKVYWDFDLVDLREQLNLTLTETRTILSDLNFKSQDLSNVPKLLTDVFEPLKLSQLYSLKNYILRMDDEHVRDLLLLALIVTLRDTCNAGGGWAYIDLGKKRTNLPEVYDAFRNNIEKIYEDLTLISKRKIDPTFTNIEQIDARNISEELEEFQGKIDFAFTSPPYLNNYDYADKTRLEFYFLSPIRLNGINYDLRTWGAISNTIRKKLLVNCSHQAVELGLREGLMPDDEMETGLRTHILDISQRLSKEKHLHGGKKDYDVMTVAYFNDMLKTFKSVFDMLKKGSYYLMVVGDSAPYGIHIPTDELLSKMALSSGFSEANLELLRSRGGKWKVKNKHQVPLRETVLILKK